jgi:UDP-glucuronate 4-epimerase
MTNRTVLVTGAAGFIGSHVTQALLGRGDTVVGVDNLDAYYAVARKEDNLAVIRDSAADAQRFQFLRGDVRDRTLVAELFAGQRIDGVVHLAAMAGVHWSISAPQLYFDVNTAGTLNLLEAACASRAGNFVLASTSSVYGGTKRIPFVETDPCDRPLAPYAASKRAAEMLGFTFHHLYGQNVTALRLFTVYGPRGRPDMMAYKVADSIFTGRPVTLYQNGQLHRDWTYVTDIVHGIVAALDHPLGYEIINLGCGQPVLVADFVRLLEESFGRRAQLVPGERPKTDMEFTCADIAKARALLGYRPATSVRQGVAGFCAWYEQSVRNASSVTLPG